MFPIPIQIRIDQAPMLFKEEKEKFQIFSIRIHEPPMLFKENKEKLKFSKF